ncbi:MAG: acyl-CoA dehydrogenase family protein [Acidimicrobiales bacterium]
MDFVLSADQEALADLIGAIVAGRFPLERTRRAEDARQVVDPDDWAALGEAGVFSLTIPEAAGGVGLGLADAAVVFEELGRGLVPGPLVASHLAGELAGGPGGAADSGLRGAADGAVVVGALRAPGPEMSGAPILVEHLDSIGALVVVGPDDRLSVLAGRSLDELRSRSRPVEHPLDPLTPLSTVDALPDGAPVPGGPVVAQRWIARSRVLVAASCVGIAGATCDLAVAYAKERHQFGRPIGSFQAVKHLCADMLVRTEVSRAAVHAAAVTADEAGAGDADRLAAGAALLAAEAADHNAKSAIQVYGGMGFTWDVPIHLYLVRTRVLAASLGPLDTLAALVAARY